MKYILPCHFQNVDNSCADKKSKFIVPLRIVIFKININFNWSHILQITLDKRELCFKLEDRCLVKNQNVVAIDTIKHHQ